VKPPLRFIVQHIGHQITRTVSDPWRVLDTRDPARPIVIDQYHTKRAAQMHARELNRQETT
jgi:hypothetical protein